MSQLRKAIIAAAREAGDLAYADWLEGLRYMSRRDMLPRARYYGLVA